MEDKKEEKNINQKESTKVLNVLRDTNGHSNDKKELKSKSKSKETNDYLKLFLGLTIVLVGILSLGKNLDLWTLNFSWFFLFPILIIIFGLILMGDKRIFKFLFFLASIFLFIILISSLFFSVRTETKNQRNSLYRSEAISDIHGSHQMIFGEHKKNIYSSGALNRREAEVKINEMLDGIYGKDYKTRVELDISIKGRR